MEKSRKGLIVTIIIVILLALAFGGYKYVENVRAENRERREDVAFEETVGYLLSDGPISLYEGKIQVEEDFWANEKSRSFNVTKITTVARGTKVTKLNHEETADGVRYTEIRLEDKTYYILSDQFTENPKDVVNFTNLYVRTPVTVYQSNDDCLIYGYLPKGTKLEILDYDSIDEDLNVNMFKIQYEDLVGWVYGKYLVETQEEADALYNEHGEADYHQYSIARYETYGGNPLLLDYYPVEKPVFENNTLLEDARTMFLCGGCSANWRAYLQCAKDMGINAVCIDIFDGIMSYDSAVVSMYSPSLYNYSINSRDFSTSDFADMVAAFKEAGIYVIGRIVCFNDGFYAADHPEDCIIYGNTNWPSVFSRGVWIYKVSLAIEAVRLFGFNEIQLDYIRFSDDTIYASANGADFRNYYGETKSQAIQNFLFYACDMIHREGAYVSADVFGSSASGVVPECGQYWSAISNVVDVICAMPYTDHFDSSDPSYWEDPYGTLKWWGGLAKELQDHTPTPAIPRTWITGYDTPYWWPYCIYDEEEIKLQAQGLADAGLYGGFLVWNAGGDLNKLYSIAGAWTAEYK